MVHARVLSSRLLGGEVANCAHDRAGQRFLWQQSSGKFVRTFRIHWLWSLNEFCQTEIKNLRVAIAGDHDVVRFQIAMNDSRRVGFCKSVCYLREVFQESAESGFVSMYFGS